jgi:hypothetical protein
MADTPSLVKSGRVSKSLTRLRVVTGFLGSTSSSDLAGSILLHEKFILDAHKKVEMVNNRIQEGFVDE